MLHHIQKEQKLQMSKVKLINWCKNTLYIISPHQTVLSKEPLHLLSHHKSDKSITEDSLLSQYALVVQTENLSSAHFISELKFTLYLTT